MPVGELSTDPLLETTVSCGRYQPEIVLVPCTRVTVTGAGVSQSGVWSLNSRRTSVTEVPHGKVMRCR